MHIVGLSNFPYSGHEVQGRDGPCSDDEVRSVFVFRLAIGVRFLATCRMRAMIRPSRSLLTRPAGLV